MRRIFHHEPTGGRLSISVTARRVDHLPWRVGKTPGWSMLRDILEGQQRAAATFNRSDGATILVSKPTRVEPE